MDEYTLQDYCYTSIRHPLDASFRRPLLCKNGLNLETENGVFICNPPYGERLGDQQQCRKLYRELYLLRQRHPTWQLCAISSDPAFERSYGKRADKKRRLYNGRLECVYYMYY